jgi:hypothetical protein
MAIREKETDMKRRVGRVLAVTALATVVGSTSPFAVANDGSGLAAPIEGTWTCTLADDAGAYSFTTLVSFAAGGVAQATGSLDRIHPASTLFGSWKHQNDGSYAVSRAFFVFDPVSGNPTGMLKNNETIQMNGHDNLAGPGELLACQVDGSNCVGPISNYTFTCERLIVQGS